MKKNVKVFASLALCVSMLLSGCGGTAATAMTEGTTTESTTVAETASSEATAEATAYADTFVVGIQDDINCLDPDQSIGATEASIMCHIYEGLVKENENLDIVPLLADSWTISDDGLTYTFDLKQDVKFSDGTAVTGEDWVFSLERARDNESSNSRSVAEPIVSVEAPDDATLVITLDEPCASFLANLCKWNMVVKSKAHFDELGGDETAFSESPLGTGPYVLTSWTKGESLKFEANPYYHEAGYPLTKNMEYKIITDDNTLLLQLQSGDVDIMVSAPASMAENIKASDGISLQEFTATQIRYLTFNCSQEPLDNQLVRQALDYATDKQEILDVVANGYGTIANSYFNNLYSDYYDDTIEARGVDYDKAKELLAEAGYPDGFEITMNVYAGNAVYEQIATCLQSEWANAGVTLTIEPLESATMKAAIKEQDGFVCTVLQWTDSTPDPNDLSAFECVFADANQYNSFVYNEDLENLYYETAKETDHEKRVELLKQLQQDVYEWCNFVPLFQGEFLYGVSDKISGLNVTPFNKMDAKMIQKAE